MVTIATKDKQFMAMTETIIWPWADSPLNNL